jgi:uncharacterized protein (UPF0261 family)
MIDHGKKIVLIVATLDTKGDEVLYLKKGIEKSGKCVMVLDCGLSGSPASVNPDITRDEVAKAGGADYNVLEKADRSLGIEVMARGVASIVRELYKERKFDGILSIGGSDGSILGTAGMRELPIGVPKLMVSAMASGLVTFGEYVGARDVTIMPSVVDVAGINVITKKIFDNAVGAISGMVDAGVNARISSNNLISMSMNGQTTACGTVGRRLLEREGFEVITFHSRGVIIEEFIEDNALAAVWDLAIDELANELFSKMHTRRLDRLEAAGKKGIPQVIVPGCLDFIWGSPGPPDNLLTRFKNRQRYFFNPNIVLIKLKREEIIKAGKVLSEKLNRSRGPVSLIYPLRGISQFDKEGEEFYTPDLDALLLEVLKKNLSSRINLVGVDGHINDPVIAKTCISVLVEMVKKKKG